ncbi:hypothetical protein [Curtobacterium sp. MCPF17_052]|uniref:hypothetical protein n=1 Tax=Curtobacterium sp. MCPF17_052 TaxID=2175655 RepID=UPI0024DFD0DF|nr:hypothetical protein [Curtobacterium sp. MCPF17_052]WIB11969.1 hypothetical protein DEJ36_14095 [Curtobacterium sp. MCPF17_052]
MSEPLAPEPRETREVAGREAPADTAVPVRFEVAGSDPDAAVRDLAGIYSGKQWLSRRTEGGVLLPVHGGRRLRGVDAPVHHERLPPRRVGTRRRPGDELAHRGLRHAGRPP